MRGPFRSVRLQAGTAAVEFSLVALIFFTLVLSIIEGGRVVYAWNSAAEATRAGARMASVSSMNSPKIEESMKKILGDLKSANISVEYLPAGCDPNSCELIQVSIVGYTIKAIVAPIPLFPVPSTRTTVQRESMGIVL